MNIQCCEDQSPTIYRGEWVCRNCGTVVERMYRDVMPYEECSTWTSPLIPISGKLNLMLEGTGLSTIKKIQLLDVANRSRDPVEYLENELVRIGIKFVQKSSSAKQKQLKIHEHYATADLIRKRTEQIRRFDVLAQSAPKKEIAEKTRFSRGKYYYWKTYWKRKKMKRPGRKEKISRYREEIENLRRAGYSYREIQMQLALNGVNVAVSTISRFIKRLKIHQAMPHILSAN